MTKGLYLFVTSDRPDQYLNPILHCLQQENPSTSKIVFVHVKDRPRSGREMNVSAKLARDNVQALLSCLADEGKYKYFAEGQKGKGEIDLKDKYPPEKVASIKEKYASAKNRNVNWLDTEIDYSKLKDELAKIHKAEPNSIFDVSAWSKTYLGDIFAIGVIEGIDNIYTFKLASRENFEEPWKSLFHELKLGSFDDDGYEYFPLTKNSIYKKCTESILILRPSLVLSLLVAFAVLITLVVTSLVFGPTNWFVLIMSSLATIASIFSLCLIFIQTRR